MVPGVVFQPSPWGLYCTYMGRAAGFEPELVKLAALPHYQWAIPAPHIESVIPVFRIHNHPYANPDLAYEMTMDPDLEFSEEHEAGSRCRTGTGTKLQILSKYH
jgi:hypothetical protein